MKTFFWEARGAGAPSLRIQARETHGPQPDTWYELLLLDDETHMGLTRLVSRQELLSLQHGIEKLVQTESDARAPLDRDLAGGTAYGAGPTVAETGPIDRLRALGGTLSIEVRFIPTPTERDRVHAGLRALERVSTFTIAVLQQAIDRMADRAEFPVWLYLEEYAKLAKMPGLNYGQWFGLVTWKLQDVNGD